MAERDLVGDVGSERQPAQYDRVDLEVVEQCDDVVGELGDEVAVGLARLGRLAVAMEVEQKDAVVRQRCRQPLHRPR